MIALAARILDLPEPEPLPPLRATARMSSPAAAAHAVVVMRLIARPATSAQTGAFCRANYYDRENLPCCQGEEAWCPREPS